MKITINNQTFDITAEQEDKLRTALGFNEKQLSNVHIILTAEDGTEYKGEFIDLRIDPATTPQGKYMIDYFQNLRRYNYERIKRK